MLLGVSAVLVAFMPVVAGDPSEVPTREPAASANVAMALEAVSPPTEPPEQSAASEPQSRAMASELKESAGIDERIPIQRSALKATGSPAAASWHRSGLIPLLTVLTAIAVAVWLAKRLLKGGHTPRGDVLQVMARTHLSPKQSIALVQMGGRLVFVGITPGHITGLRVVADHDEAAWLRGRLRAGATRAEQAEFDRLLNTEGVSLSEALESQAEAQIEPVQRMMETRRNLRGLLDQLKSHQKMRT